MSVNGHKSRVLRVEKWNAIRPQTQSNYLIDGWMDLGTMVVTYGDSNTGKSNIALSQAVAIATGEDWCGSRTLQGPVVYVALEGGGGMRKRIAAYKKEYSLEDIQFYLVPGNIDLSGPQGDSDSIIEVIQKAKNECGTPCRMVIIDTLARALADGDENTSRDMGGLVRECDKIRSATGATIHLIHHSGKKRTAGARGSSALRAATDTEIEITGNRAGGKAKVTKQRDIGSERSAKFKYDTVTIVTDEEGNHINSIVTRCEVDSAAQTDTGGSNPDLVALRNLIFANATIIPKDPEKYDRDEVTVETCQFQVGSREWKTKLGLKKGDAADDKKFERLAKDLVEVGLINAQASGGRESKWSLLPRQTATKPDMSE